MMTIPETSRARDIFVNSIRALTEALEAKDHYAAGHSMRVAQMAVEIAKALDLAPRDVAQIRLGATLHDLGKIGVRESVLHKNGPLTDEEYKHVMEHCLIGKKILAPIFRRSVILEIVMHHHEHYNGKGFPDGLAGTKIPLAARIVALADAVDAMESDRPYRPGLPLWTVASRVRKASGAQFDRKVVDAFFKTPHGIELSAAKEEPAEATTDISRDPIEETSQQGKIEILSAPKSAESESAEEQVEDVPEGPPEKPFLTPRYALKAVVEYHDLKILPFVTAEVLQLTARVDTNIDTLVQTILRDPSLVAKILKLGNTSFYNSRGRVQTIERAIVNIGFSGIRELAMAVSVVNLFETRQKGHNVDRFALWNHNIACAAIARGIATVGGTISAEAAFVGGLLHDLGIAVLDDVFPKEYGKCVAHVRYHGLPLAPAEKAFIGIDHTEAGQEISKGWNVEERFCRVMACHHDSWSSVSDMPGENGLLVAAVKLADTLARALGEGDDCDSVVEEVPRSALRKLKVDAGQIANVRANLGLELTELKAVFLLHESVDNKDLEKPEPPKELAGKNALIIDAAERPVDVPRIILENLGVVTAVGATISAGAAEQMPDLVVLRAKDEAALRANLKQLGDMSSKGLLDFPYAVILGGNRLNGKLSSLYPERLVISFEEPYSVSIMRRHLVEAVTK